MPRQLSPAEAAKRLQKWADVGIDAALVDGLVAGLKPDAAASRSRAPHKSGRLAATIRVTSPRPERTKRTGTVRAGLIAGSSSGDRRKAVQYASVLQTGKVGYPPRGSTRPHPIRARRAGYAAGEVRTTGVLAFNAGGTRVYARSVQHPGSHFPALGYLAVDERRLATVVDRSLQKSEDREVG